MRYFHLVDLQYVILLLFLGSAALLLLVLAFGGYGVGPRKKDGEEDLEPYPDGIRAGSGPIPPILIFVYIGTFAWAMGYLFLVGVGGGAF